MSESLPVRLRDPLTRRSLSVSVVAVGSAALGSTAALWAPLAAAADVATSGLRFPRTRLLGFAWAWTSLETMGVAAAGALAATGRRDDRTLHYALQRWWAARLIDALRVFTDLRIEVDGLDALAPGPIVMCARHASIVDSLLPAWLLGRVGMRPRYVLKDDLLVDPCLDIVGHRIPNHFVDRTPEDLDTELAEIEALASGMGRADAAVIFPEGMVVTETRRARAVERLATRDPERAERLRGLRVLAPIRPAGTTALLRGAPDADVVFVTHTGLEALQRVGDAVRSLPLRTPVRVSIRRVARRDVPRDGFESWLDQQWSAADGKLAAAAGVGPGDA
ncbi:MAG: 1-acyl-sn-glycerol-3-phosphate acyltransferase [Acidimicrobiia bacterium]